MVLQNHMNNSGHISKGYSGGVFSGSWAGLGTCRPQVWVWSVRQTWEVDCVPRTFIVSRVGWTQASRTGASWQDRGLMGLPEVPGEQAEVFLLIGWIVAGIYREALKIFTLCL